MSEESDRRKIMVPGRSVDVTMIVKDTASNMVLAVPVSGEVVVLFVSPKPTARVMSNLEAHEFSKGIRDAYLAFHDDAKIKEMEREFDERD